MLKREKEEICQKIAEKMESANQFDEILAERLVRENFQFPITFTMIGINGHVFAGRLEFSVTAMRLDIIIVTGGPEKLRFPINTLLVDRTGKTAHVFSESPNGEAQLTTFRVGHA